MKNNFIYYSFSYADVEKKLSVKAKSLIFWLLSHSEYNKGYIKLTSEDRKNAMDYLRCNASFLSRLLKELRDNELIYGKAKIMINPYLFWYGDLDERLKYVDQQSISSTSKQICD